MCTSAPTDFKVISTALPQSLRESISKEVYFRTGLPLTPSECSPSNYETRSLKDLPV